MENNLEAILSSITSNPDLMQKISEITKNSDGTSAIGEVVSLLSPHINGSNSTQGEEKAEESASSKGVKEESDTPKESLSILGSVSNTISRNTPLLLALKPYLSKERAKIIDSVIALSKVASISKLL